MDKKKVAEFFDMYAPVWDDEMIRDDNTVEKIMAGLAVPDRAKALDAACGTGVMIPDYFRHGAASVTGIDISPKMAEKAKEKYAGDPRIDIICGDIETYEFGEPFDCALVYNALPHFGDPELLIRVLADDLRNGGRLSVAHGMSREKIDRHHQGLQRDISRGLISAEDLSKIFGKYFDVDVIIENEEYYQVAGTKR